ncbi:PREDICTED: abhydrolase domain-containing protein 16A-like [Pseudopodoces humilis]|uniref:abhydrolase domain-containing protein 16A-like n=1 Tax=Pseudopodoces humilis TaxID=181119 RepID=UPI0006B7BFC5|nr:PREDICTED: abhydrolase domain-containing protein 16A-like [Pseudopodoces humilis]
MAKLLSCVLGPRLYRVHRPRLAAAAAGSPAGPRDTEGAGSERGEPAWDSYYQPRGLEKHTDSVLALASVLWSISCYASPLAVLYLYRKGLLTMSRVVPLSHCAATLGLLLAGVACLRGLGRWSNPQYREFLAALEESHRSGTPESKRKLGLYTFDFRSWPVDFRWDSAGPAWGGARAVPLLRSPPRPRGGSRGLLGALRKLPCAVIRLLLARTLGRRMLFPGSVRLLQRALLPALLQGQARLIEQVICCEGNAGFYEGVPLPQSEANAMDVVIRFALQQLRFPAPNIVLYAWSIGGFPGTGGWGGSRDGLGGLGSVQAVRGWFWGGPRYPKLLVDEGLQAVREWLQAATPEEESAVLGRCPPDEGWCRGQLEAFAGDRSPPFPWSLGEELSPAQRRQLALYLVSGGRGRGWVGVAETE